MHWKVIRCAVCNRLVPCDGDPGPVGAVRIPGNHIEIEDGLYAEPAADPPFCRGSEMNSIVEIDPDYCKCESGLPWRELSDARGIYVARVCDACEERVKAKYRADIFEDSDYETDEPIEEDY